MVTASKLTIDGLRYGRDRINETVFTLHNLETEQPIKNADTHTVQIKNLYLAVTG